MVNGRKAKKKKQIGQFVAIFHLLKHGEPMTDFEHIKYLFDFLKIHHMPKKQWTNSIGWGMATAMHNVILKHIMLLVQYVKLISISCDEVATLDNQSWISIHVYIVSNQLKVPIFFNLERIINGSTFDKLTFVIICYFSNFGGMSKIDIANKVVYFGVDNVTIFQGLKTNVIVQLVNKHCPFVLGIHCVAHQCNFTI